MSTKERINLAAPCGIDCGICELYICKDNKQLYDHMISRGIPEEKLPCGGCRNVNGNCPVIAGECETYKCMTKKKVEFCSDCADFPCYKLAPAADRADVLPHNTKVFNLCIIKKIGIEGFLERSAEIKQIYYKGKMEVGKGPKSDN